MGNSLLDKQWTVRFPHIALVIAGILVVLAATFGVWTATSVLSFPLFVLSGLFLIYLPGELVLDAAKLDPRPLDRLPLALIAGMTVSGLLYYLSALAGAVGAFAIWPLLALGWRAYKLWRGWPGWWAVRCTLTVDHLMLAGVLFLCVAPLTILPAYYGNLDLLPNGGMTFLRRPNDAIFHLSIANELTHSIPPQAPFLAGLPLGYHFGMDLLVAMFARLARVSVADSTVRFLPTFLTLTVVLAVFSFSRLWLRSGRWAVLCAFLVVLGEDFSFIPGLLTGSTEVWSAQFFGMPTTFSLYFMNPMLPALAVLFGGLFCLAKYSRGDGRNYAFLSAFLFAIVTEYKVFTTLQVAAALGVAGLVYLALFRDRRLLQVLALTLLLSAPLALYSVFGTQASSRVWLRVEPWPYIPEAIEQMGLLGTSVGRGLEALFHGHGLSVPALGALVLVALPAYLAGSLGARVLAIPGVLRGLFSPRADGGTGFFLSLFAVLGALATLTLTVTPRGYPSGSEYNNAVWFYVQSKYVLWILALEWVMRVTARRPGRWRVGTVMAIVLLSLPSSLQFFRVQASQPTTVLASSEVELVEALGASLPSGQVVISRQEVAEVVVSLTPCRVPVLNLGIYPHSFVSMAELAERRADRDEFWEDWNEGRVRDDILERYGVKYVVVDRRQGDATLVDLPESRGGSPGSEGSVPLSRFFQNEDFVIYAVGSENELGA
jgi:hypothetical protein